MIVAGNPQASTPAAANHELSESLRVEAVAPGVWRHVSTRDLQGFGPVPANGLVVVGKDEAALIDTPWTDDQTALLFRFVERELGVKITHVVATHSHGDCMGGLAEAHRRGAQSYALELTARFAADAGDPVPLRRFTERDGFSLGNIDVELRYFGGGHTRDNIVVWLPQRSVLFGGCLVKRTGGSAGYTAESDLVAWPETLRKVIAAFPKVQIVVPGHGSPGTMDYLNDTIKLCCGISTTWTKENSPRRCSAPSSTQTPRSTTRRPGSQRRPT